MTSCKEINERKEPKRLVFDVRVKLDIESDREDLVTNLKDTGWSCLTELADIIEKG